MSQKKRGLGRGLSDLGLNELLSDMKNAGLSATATLSSPHHPSLPPALETELREIPLDKIRPGLYQPRRTFDQGDLQELAQSIQSQGVIQPIVLRRMNDGYEIIAGERRWRAAQLAKLDRIPAIVRDISDKTAIAVALIENIQRRDLNAIEEATALQRLITEFHLTHQEVAESVGKSRTLVTNLLRLLKLNSDVRDLVEKKQLEMGHARALLTLEADQQSEMANRVVARGLSVRQTETLVRHLQNGKQPSSSTSRLDPNVSALQNQLSECLSAKVMIQHNDTKGKGKLVVQYYSLEELEGILEKIRAG